MTQSFTETIENNFEAAKSEIETIKSTYTPLNTIQGINQSISTLNSTVNKTITVLETSGTIALSDNSENYCAATGSIVFSLPAVSDTTIKHRIEIELYMASRQSINVGLGDTPNYFNETEPDLSKAGVYNLFYEYSRAKSAWILGAIPIGEAE